MQTNDNSQNTNVVLKGDNSKRWVHANWSTVSLTSVLLVGGLAASSCAAQHAHSPHHRSSATPTPAAGHETLGGGTVGTAALGPRPSFGLGGPGMVLVKNWHFGSSGTVKNYADMNANFLYHDQFGTINNGGKYGANMVSPDVADSIGGQPIEGVDCPPVRKFTSDSLLTFLQPLGKVANVQVRNHNTGNGSFMGKWRLPNGGSLLGHDIVWETRVRYVTPPYFWFAIWTAGNKWMWDGKNGQGAEQDLVESFGYDNGNNNTNYDGRFWHSNAVAAPSKDDWNFWDWGGTMTAKGIPTYDATKYHIWTWVYKKDNSYVMYVDGKRVQGGTNYYWTYGNGAKDEPIDMDFLFDASWGHNQIGSVNKELPASAFVGKFYEWNYSRVYLSNEGETPRGGRHNLPGIIKVSDYNVGAEGEAFGNGDGGDTWRKYTVFVPVGGRYRFSCPTTALKAGDSIQITDSKGLDTKIELVTASNASAKVVQSKPVTLSSGEHVLKVMMDADTKLPSFSVEKTDGPVAAFISTESKTQGSWKGVYGSEGYMIAGDKTVQPKFGTITKTGWTVTWNGNTDDVRATQKVDGGPKDRVAGQWGTNDPSFDIDCNFTDKLAHRVALYGIDWDKNGRTANIQVIDPDTGGLIDTQEINTYTLGKYLIWNVRGHVVFRVVNTSHWTNPAFSGIFVDPVPKSADKLAHR